MTTSPTSLDRPPTLHELNAALARLRPHAAWDRTKAALHLTLPVDAPVGLAVWDDGTTWRYGDATLAHDAPADQIHATIGSVVRATDRFHNLAATADGATWCKVVRSGTQTLVFGGDILFGAPAMSAGLDVDHDVLFGLVATWERDGAIDSPAFVAAPTGLVLVDGAADWVHVDAVAA
jgi:hypothetical protein